MEGSLEQAGPDGARAETSARTDRYKEYLKEKRTEANRLKQRRLRERRAKHLEALERTVLNLQRELARASAEIQRLKADNAGLEMECRRLAEQLVVRTTWDAGYVARPDVVQHVGERHTVKKHCTRPIHANSKPALVSARPASDPFDSGMNFPRGQRQAAEQAPLSPPLSIYHPPEPVVRPFPASTLNQSNAVPHPVVAHSLPALVPHSVNQIGSLLPVQPRLTHPCGPAPPAPLASVYQAASWETCNALGIHAGASSVGCSPAPFPPAMSSGSTATMISRPDTPVSSSFNIYPPYVDSGSMGFPAGTSAWPYAIDHAFVPRSVPIPVPLPFDANPVSCPPPIAIGPCSAVASAPQIASRKPVKGAARAANAKPPLVPPDGGAAPAWTTITASGSCPSGSQGPDLIPMPPPLNVSEPRTLWPA